MSEIVFTGQGNASFDRLVQTRAQRYAEMSERERRVDRSGVGMRRLYDRVYTTNLRDDPATIVRRNAWGILGYLFPGSVLAGRTALTTSVAKDPANPDGPGYVFLTAPYRRNVSLPGLEVRMVEGPGRLPGDMDFLGLILPSPARALLENLAPSRARACVARTAGRREVEQSLVKKAQVSGEESLNEIRDAARELREPLNATAEFNELTNIIGALLGSREDETLLNPQAIAMAAGEPFDAACVDRLNALFSFLKSNPMPRRPDLGKGTPAATNTAFVEAYFSNYIEGTTFLISEATDIVFEGWMPDSRPKDGHDVLSTFRLLADYEGMRRAPDRFDDFMALVRARHDQLMGARPEVNPGQFKTKVNRAGNTVFVRPNEVVGTFRRGVELLTGLEDPFARAMFIHFLVSDIHPFIDGNGRLARIMMASELTAGGQSRIVIPTVFRDDYLAGQRSMTRNMDPGPNFRMLNRAQEMTAAIVENDRDTCIRRWASTHAFVEPGVNATLTPPTDGNDVEFADGVPAPASYWADERNGENTPFRA